MFNPGVAGDSTRDTTIAQALSRGACAFDASELLGEPSEPGERLLLSKPLKVHRFLNHQNEYTLGIYFM